MKHEYRLEELFVEVTNRCLMGCVHCSSCAGPDTKEYIPIGEIKRLIENAMPLGLKSFTISGGEPFLYPHLEELASHIVKRGLALNIYSCGIIKDEQTNTYLSLSLKELGPIAKLNPHKLIFSLHGGRGSHESITGIHGSFNITVNSIKAAMSLGIEVEIHFVPMTLNSHALHDVIKLASDIGVKRVSLLRLVNHGRCLDHLVLSPEQEDSLYEDAQKFRMQYPVVDVRMGSPYNCITMSGKPCSAGKNKLLISGTGEVFPCEAFKSLKGQRPTIYELPLEELWFNDSLLNQVRDLNLYGAPSCQSCYHYRQCGGGCHGERMIANERIDVGVDPLCLKLRSVIKERVVI